MDNPDCIIYGFAIGDSGSEKSKVVVDTAFSITSFDDSHETFTLNAPYENGTMAAKGEMKELPKGKDKGKLDGGIVQLHLDLINKITFDHKFFSLALLLSKIQRKQAFCMFSIIFCVPVATAHKLLVQAQ
jgi:hypothetical protein